MLTREERIAMTRLVRNECLGLAPRPEEEDNTAQRAALLAALGRLFLAYQIASSKPKPRLNALATAVRGTMAALRDASAEP